MPGPAQLWHTELPLALLTPLSPAPHGDTEPWCPGPGSHHGDEAADEAEVGEVVGVDGGGGVDLQAVVVLARVLEEAVHGVEHLMGQQEEPLPGMRQGGRGDKQLGEGTVCVPAPSGCPAGVGHWCDWVRVFPSLGCCVGFGKCFWRFQLAADPTQSTGNLGKCHTQSQLGWPTHTHPQMHPVPPHTLPREPHTKPGTAPSWLCSPGRAGRLESSDVEAAPASRPWFYPVVEQHDVTYHRVKPLAGHGERWSSSRSRGSSPTKGSRRTWGGSRQGHANPAPRRWPR